MVNAIIKGDWKVVIGCQCVSRQGSKVVCHFQSPQDKSKSQKEEEENYKRKNEEKASFSPLPVGIFFQYMHVYAG